MVMIFFEAFGAATGLAPSAVVVEAEEGDFLAMLTSAHGGVWFKDY